MEDVSSYRPSVRGAGLGLWVAAVALAVVAAGCLRWSEESAEDAGTTPPAGTGQQEAARRFFDAYPVKDYDSYEEAEAEAGFHIPRPSPEYPNPWGGLSLQWFPQYEYPNSAAVYIYPAGSELYFHVTCGPGYWFLVQGSGTEEAIPNARPAVLGGKQGWVRESDFTSYFYYRYGELDGYGLWCKVGASNEIDPAEVERFIATLQ